MEQQTIREQVRAWKRNMEMLDRLKRAERRLKAGEGSRDEVEQILAEWVAPAPEDEPQT